MNAREVRMLIFTTMLATFFAWAVNKLLDKSAANLGAV